MSVAKVIEINCRFGINDAALARKFADLPVICYRDCRGSESPPQRPTPMPGLTWYDFSRDTTWYQRYGKAKNLTVGRWLVAAGRMHDSYALFDWRDPMPAVVNFLEPVRRRIWSRARKRSQLRSATSDGNVIRETCKATGEGRRHCDNEDSVASTDKSGLSRMRRCGLR